MSWWRSWSTRRRAAAVVAVVTVVVGSVGAAYAVTGGEDDPTQAASGPTPSQHGPFAPTSDSSSDTSTDSGGADGGTGRTERSSRGQIVVRINPASGKHPIEIGATAYDVDTGAEIGTAGQLCCHLTQVTLDVPAGRYRVIAGSDDDGWETAWYGLTTGVDADKSQARIVEVEPGETVSVDVELIEWPGGERPDTPGFDWGDDDTDPTPPSTPAPQPTSTTPELAPTP